ncbi:MAG: hypothetical protein OIF47_06655 [Marinibacterium sp.]|nr:hypothetical protein [Marinibacterium sp.]
MRTVLLTLPLLSLTLAPVMADTPYEGRQLQALQCADYFATAALELEDELDADTRGHLYSWSAVILTTYVDGPWHQKDTALKEIVAGRSLDEAVQGYRDNHDSCAAEFPFAP